jgi:hypothetical protein
MIRDLHFIYPHASYNASMMCVICSKEELNRKGRGGQTPLMFAVLAGKQRAVLPLLEAGRYHDAIP